MTRARDWIDRLQNRLWLDEVRSWYPATNHQLNKKFASPLDMSSADVVKEFGRIERDGKEPREEVLRRVDEAIPGTRLMYEAPFWGFLRLPPTSLIEAHQQVEELLSAYGLARVDWLEASQALFGPRPVDQMSVFNEGLRRSLMTLQWHESASLLLALYSEADGAENFDAANSIRLTLDRVIDLAMSRLLPWPEAPIYYEKLSGLCSVRKVTLRDSDLANKMRIEGRTAMPLLSKDWISMPAHLVE